MGCRLELITARYIPFVLVVTFIPEHHPFHQDGLKGPNSKRITFSLISSPANTAVKGRKPAGCFRMWFTTRMSRFNRAVGYFKEICFVDLVYTEHPGFCDRFFGDHILVTLGRSGCILCRINFGTVSFAATGGSWGLFLRQCQTRAQPINKTMGINFSLYISVINEAINSCNFLNNSSLSGWQLQFSPLGSIKKFWGRNGWHTIWPRHCSSISGHLHGSIPGYTSLDGFYPGCFFIFLIERYA